MSENRFGLPDSMVNPHWLAVWSGYEVRWPSEVGQIVTQHLGQPGAVLVFRYAPVRQFGSVVDRMWGNVLVQIDEEPVAVASPTSATPTWVPLAAGPHRLAIHKAEIIAVSKIVLDRLKGRPKPTNRYELYEPGPQLAAAEFDVDREPVVVAITPRRKQGMVPGYTTPRIDVGSPANSAKTASTGDERQ